MNREKWVLTILASIVIGVAFGVVAGMAIAIQININSLIGILAGVILGLIFVLGIGGYLLGTYLASQKSYKESSSLNNNFDSKEISHESNNRLNQGNTWQMRNFFSFAPIKNKFSLAINFIEYLFPDPNAELRKRIAIRMAINDEHEKRIGIETNITNTLENKLLIARNILDGSINPTSVDPNLFGDDIVYNNTLWLPDISPFMSSLRELSASELEKKFTKEDSKCKNFSAIRELIANHMDDIDRGYEQLENDAKTDANNHDQKPVENEQLKSSF